MVLTHFEAVMGGIAALFASLAVIGAGLRWIYRQGVSSTRLVSAIETNTSATATLSTAFGKFSEKTGGTLVDHEHRITRTEDRLASLTQDVDRRREAHQS